MVKKKIPNKETIKLLNKHLGYIRRKFAPEKIILFGSRARGDHFTTSDIDLIIVSKKFKKIKFYDRMIQVYGNWNNQIDLESLCYTPEEFEKKKKQIGIVRQAVKEGILIG